MQIDKSNKSLLIGLVGVFTLFMVLVPVYFAFSNGLPDGLDKQLQENRVQEKNAGMYTSVWSVNQLWVRCTLLHSKWIDRGCSGFKYWRLFSAVLEGVGSNNRIN